MSRSAEKEKLDDLSLSGEPLHQALQSLAWINKWFGNHRAVTSSVLSVYKAQPKRVRITDLGCGGGDLVLAVAKALQQKHIPFSITGIDGNANALAYAQQQCAAFADVQFVQADILADNFTIPPCDILISSHFVYHFTDHQLTGFLGNNLLHINRALIFSELERNRLAMILFKALGYLLPISKLARADGLLAIKRAFTKKEWLLILQKANIGSFRLKRVPLFRIQLIIFKPGETATGKLPYIKPNNPVDLI